MDSSKRLAAIAAILNELGIEADLDSHDSRLQMQKSIYLAQAAGLDLGYRFNWYVRGPYSPNLADDYYEAFRDPDFAGTYIASQDLRNRLQGVKNAIGSSPSSATTTEWLEALASVDFIRRVQRKRSLEEARKKFEAEKPKLVRFFDQAFETSTSLGS